MNIMELGAIGELVGGMAVIGSLVFVGFQVRRSNVEARERNKLEAATANQTAGRDYRALMLSITDGAMASVYRRGVIDFYSLTKDEQMQLNWWFATQAVHLQEIWYYDETRLMNTKLQQTFVRFFVSILKMPGAAQWWSEMSLLWDPGFVREIDDLLRQPDSAPVLVNRVPWYFDDAATPEGRA